MEKSENYIANKNTMQFHRKNCVWVEKISEDHKCFFQNIDQALLNKFDGCAFCLPAYHNYKQERIAEVEKEKEEKVVEKTEAEVEVEEVKVEIEKVEATKADSRQSKEKRCEVQEVIDTSPVIEFIEADPLVFEKTTTIKFVLNRSATISVSVLNKNDNTLVYPLIIDQLYYKGEYTIEWNGNNINDEQVKGIFRCIIKSEGEQKFVENLHKRRSFFPSIIYNQDLDKGPLKDTHVAYSILSYKDQFSREDAIEHARNTSVNKLFLVFAGQQGVMGKAKNIIGENMDDLFCIDLTGGDKYIKEGNRIWKGDYKICTYDNRKSTASSLFEHYRNDGLVVDVVNTKFEWVKKQDKKKQILDNFFSKGSDGLGELIECFIKKNDGRIFICGFSRGGVFSLKVAERLRAMYGNNHKIKAVVTIDPVINPLSTEWSSSDEENIVKYFAAHMKKLQTESYQKRVKDKFVAGYFKKSYYYVTNRWGKKKKKVKKTWVEGYWTYKTVTRKKTSWVTKWYEGISGAEIIAKGVAKMVLDPFGIFTSQDSRLLAYRLRFPILKNVPGVAHYNVFQRLALQNLSNLKMRKTPVGSAVDKAISPYEDSYWQTASRKGKIKPVDNRKPFNQYDTSVKHHTPDMLGKFWEWIVDIAYREM